MRRVLSLPRTIEYVDGKVRLINQLKLPSKLEYIETSDWKRVAEAIKKMEIRGAPAIGVAAAMALALAVREIRTENLSEAFSYLKSVADALISTRPTAVNLSWAVKRVLKVAENAKSIDELVKKVEEEAVKIWR